MIKDFCVTCGKKIEREDADAYYEEYGNYCLACHENPRIKRGDPFFRIDIDKIEDRFTYEANRFRPWKRFRGRIYAAFAHIKKTHLSYPWLNIKEFIPAYEELLELKRKHPTSRFVLESNEFDYFWKRVDKKVRIKKPRGKIFVRVGDERKSQAEWARTLGISRERVRQLMRHGRIYKRIQEHSIKKLPSTAAL